MAFESERRSQERIIGRIPTYIEEWSDEQPGNHSKPS